MTSFAENETILAPNTEGWGIAFEHCNAVATLAKSAAVRIDGRIGSILN